MWWRLGFAVVAMALIKFFPSSPISTSYFILVILCTVLSSFASYVDLNNLEKLLNQFYNSTVQFVGISAFHTQIADPVIGGTYMTASLFLLSTSFRSE